MLERVIEKFTDTRVDHSSVTEWDIDEEQRWLTSGKLVARLVNSWTTCRVRQTAWLHNKLCCTTKLLSFVACVSLSVTGITAALVCAFSLCTFCEVFHQLLSLASKAFIIQLYWNSSASVFNLHLALSEYFYFPCYSVTYLAGEVVEL